MRQRTRIILSFIIALAIAGKAGAQPTTYEELNRKNAQEKELQRYMDLRKPKPSPSTSTVVSPYDRRENERRAAEAETAQKQQDAYNKRHAAQEEERRENAQRINDERERKAQDVRDANKKYKAAYLASFSGGEVMNENNMEEMDYAEYKELSYFYAGFDQTVPDFSEAVNANLSFRKNKNTATYKQLQSLFYKMQTTPSAAKKCLAVMYERFPEMTDSTERSEFIFSHYYFGSYLWAAYPTVARYPLSQYELMRQKDTALSFALIDRFLLLAKKFPADVLETSGMCRYSINPFYLKGAYMYYSDSRFGYDEKERLEAYKVLLFSHYPVLSKNDEDFNQRMLVSRFENVISYFNHNKSGWNYIKNISADDWKKIAAAQSASVDGIARAFMDPDDTGDYTKQYKNLTKALKN